MYCAYITKLKNVRPHSNANALLLADCFSNTVCVGINSKEGDIGVYFPTDGQLSVEFAKANNLLRIKQPDGTYTGGYLDEDKRHIRSIKLRGEKSDGLFLPLTCFEPLGIDTTNLQIGDTVTTLDGHLICEKYIPKKCNRVGAPKQGGIKKKKGPLLSPLFKEHSDTSQLAYNLSNFHCGDLVEFSLKMHGTSGRTGFLPTFKGYAKQTWLQKLLKVAPVPQYDWDLVTGTRRVVIGDFSKDGYHGNNKFRWIHAETFRGKLQKGETVYYEIVGYTETAPIMSTCSNKKVQDKEFVKQYGKETVFSYGCGQGQCDMYIYRMTMTNEDGYVVEYTPDMVRYRAEQMGVKVVPLFATMIIPQCDDPGAAVLEKAEEYWDGVDPIGKTHIREGVVVRILNRPNFAAYKHKNFFFKVLEGIIKDVAEVADMEEADDEV